MAATAYGFDASTVKARPDFSASKDAKGAWEASNSFTMLRDTWENFARLLFVKGTVITDLYVELPNYWSFLTLDEVDVRHEAGAITIVSCSYVGFDDEEGELVYTLSAARAAKPIQEHPLFIQDLKGADRIISKNKILAALRGEWKLDTDAEVSQFKITYESVNPLTDPYQETIPEAVKWGRMIFEEGHKTFMAPTLQWTEERSSKDGWKDEDLDKFGLVEFTSDNRPPGNPPMPVNSDFDWLKIGMNQTTTNGLTTQSQTWELSQPGGFARFPNPDQAQGLYNYNMAEIDGPLQVGNLEGAGGL